MHICDLIQGLVCRVELLSTLGSVKEWIWGHLAGLV